MQGDGAGMTVRENELSERILGAAIEVHRALGPGLLEHAYRECLAHELTLRGLPASLRLCVERTS